MRKISIYSGILILFCALVYLGIRYYPFHEEKPVIQTFSTKQNPAYKAVPMKSPLIVEIKDQNGFFNALKGDKEALSALRGIPEIETIFSSISHFRSFADSRTGIKNLLEGKSVIISVNPSGKNQLALLFLAQMNNAAESTSAADVVSNELGVNFTISRRNYDNALIFNARSEKNNFFYACVNDVFMASEDFILVEDAIRHSRSQNLLSNREFLEAYKTIEETALANVFINHLTFHQILARMAAPEIRKSLNRLSSYSNWTALNLTVNASELSLDGFSITRDSTDTFLNVYRHQEAEKMTIENAIPANSSYFSALNLKSTGTYLDNYEAYLRAKGDYYPREMSLMDFRKKTGTDPAKLFKDIAANQFAGVYTTINKSNPKQNRFFVAEVTDRSDAEEKISKAVADYGKSLKTSDNTLKTTYSPGGKKSVEIYRLPVANMAESLLGKAFSGINAEYVALYDKYLICGDNLPGMKAYLQSLASEKTLSNDSTYQAHNRKSLDRALFTVYGKVPKVFRLKDVLTKPEISQKLSESEDIIRKYSTFTWQLSVSDQMIENHISLIYDPLAKEEPQAVWQFKLEGPLASQPKFVLNHKDLPNREVIVFDKKNNVSLINKEGLVLWTINIPDEIVSDIHQIDLYRNNRFQYIFNTKTQLYVIDRMGNKVGKFPVTLKSIASNGVTVAEFGKNKEYRFFVAGEDRKIYAFDRDGRLFPKWNTEETSGLVTRPVQHFVVDDKDFVVASDNQNIYFLDRQGKPRDVQPAPFGLSANQIYYANAATPELIATDQSGKIHRIDFTGEARIQEVGKFSAGHRFSIGDIDQNGSVEYLFAEGKKLTIFDQSGKKIAEHAFTDNISETPQVVLPGSANSKIGVVVGNENKIYLIDKKGSVVRGFPLEGNSAFIIGKFNEANSWVNLIVGSEGNSLNNYRIE